MKNYVCWKNARTKGVTKLPDFLMKMKGKADARAGSGVVGEVLENLNKRQHMIEAAECVVAENYLSSSRKAAAKLLHQLENAEKKSAHMPVDSDGGSATAIRTNRRNQSEKNVALANIHSAMDMLCEIYQDIVSVQVILEERIKNARAKSKAKMRCYIAGVRKIIPDYQTTPEEWDTSAIDAYNTKHSSLDTASREKVEMIFVKEEKNEIV